jgi:hypothetical protein
MPLWPRLLAGFFVLAILTTSCSDYRDVVVFNPCSTAIRVSFAGSEQPADSPEGWRGATAVPSEKATTIQNVLADVGEPSWVRIEFDGAAPQVRQLPFPFPSDDAPVPVLIAARSCP